MPTQDEFTLDTRRVRRSFGRAAKRYDAAATLQAEIRREHLGRLDLVRLSPALVLDVGAGTGATCAELKLRYRKARVVALDAAAGMLREARRHQTLFRRFDRVCGDAARLPLRTASVDLLFSNLMLHWCNDPEEVFREFRRVLRPGGLLSFTSFGPDTLRELREAWTAADDRTHVSRFIDMHDLGDAMVRAGLTDPVLDVDRHVLGYPEVLDLMRELKRVGAHNSTAGRPRGLTGQGGLRRMTLAYEALRRDGRLPATFEVIYGQAWGPAGDRRQPGAGSEVSVPVSGIGRRGTRG